MKLRGPKKANVRDAAVARANEEAATPPTPRPWVAMEADGEGNYEIGILEDDMVCDHVAFVTDDPGRGVAKANAELIVRAVNAHDELVEACRSALSDCTSGVPATERQRANLAEKLRAAIAKAGAK